MTRWLILFADAIAQGLGWALGVVAMLWVLDRLGANVALLF